MIQQAFADVILVTVICLLCMGTGNVTPPCDLLLYCLHVSFCLLQWFISAVVFSMQKKRTVLHHAAECGFHNVVKLLLDKQTDADAVDEVGLSTPCNLQLQQNVGDSVFQSIPYHLKQTNHDDDGSGGGGDGGGGGC